MLTTLRALARRMSTPALARAIGISPSTLRRWIRGAPRNRAVEARALEQIEFIRGAIFDAAPKPIANPRKRLKGIVSEQLVGKPKGKSQAKLQLPKISHSHFVGLIRHGYFNDMIFDPTITLTPDIALAIYRAFARHLTPHRGWTWQIGITGNTLETSGFASDNSVGSGTFLPSSLRATKRRRLGFKSYSHPEVSLEGAKARLAAVLSTAANYHDVRLASVHVVEAATEKREIPGRRH